MVSLLPIIISFYQYTCFSCVQSILIESCHYIFFIYNDISMKIEDKSEYELC